MGDSGFFRYSVLLSCMPRIRIAGSYGSSVFLFIYFFTLIMCESLDALACPLFPPCGFRNQTQVIGIVSKCLYRLRWGLFLTFCGTSMLFLMDWTSLLRSSQEHEDSLFPKSLPALVIFVLSDSSCSGWHWAISHCSFHLHTSGGWYWVFFESVGHLYIFFWEKSNTFT